MKQVCSPSNVHVSTVRRNTTAETALGNSLLVKTWRLPSCAGCYIFFHTSAIGCGCSIPTFNTKTIRSCHSNTLMRDTDCGSSGPEFLRTETRHAITYPCIIHRIWSGCILAYNQSIRPTRSLSGEACWYYPSQGRIRKGKRCISQEDCEHEPSCHRCFFFIKYALASWRH
jgi:hypothetical protein